MGYLYFSPSQLSLSLPSKNFVCYAAKKGPEKTCLSMLNFFFIEFYTYNRFIDSEHIDGARIHDLNYKRYHCMRGDSHEDVYISEKGIFRNYTIHHKKSVANHLVLQLWQRCKRLILWWNIMRCSLDLPGSVKLSCYKCCATRDARISNRSAFSIWFESSPNTIMLLQRSTVTQPELPFFSAKRVEIQIWFDGVPCR